MKPLFVLLRDVSLPELAARPVRSALVVGAVAIGVALLTGMRVATDSIVSGFAGDLERMGGRADLQVTFGTGEVGFPEELLAQVTAEPFVQQAAALVHGQVTFEDAGGEDGTRADADEEVPDTVDLFGIDLLQKDVLDLYGVTVLQRERDDFAILNDPRALFVTERVAAERGLAVGSTVTLSGVDGTQDYTVRGVVAGDGLASFLGGRLVAMYLPAAQPVAGRRGDLRASMVDQIDVKLVEGASIEDARTALETKLGAGFVASTPVQRRLVGERTVEGLRATLVGMSTLALLAAVFIIHASTTTMVVQRLPSMATLVSVGTSPRLLVGTVVAESALLGVVGSIVGTGLGLLLASFLGGDAAAGMGLNYSLSFDADRLWYDPWAVHVAHPLGATFLAGLAAWIPARRVRGANPLALTRDADSAAQRPWSPWRLLAGAVVIASTGVALLSMGLRAASAAAVSAGGVVLVAGAVLAMLPILGVAWERLVPFLARTAGPSGRIAGESLLRARERSLVVASSIMLSVAIAVGAGSLVESFRASVADWYGFAGDALVSSRSVSGGWIAAPLRRDLESSLRSMPSVAEVETLRILQGQPYDDARIAVVGLSDGLLRSALGNGNPGIDAQAFEAIAAGRAVAVSQNFVAHFPRITIESLVHVATTSGERRLPVVAVVPDYVSDKGSIVVSSSLLSTAWGDSLANYFSVKLAAGARTSDLEAEIAGLGEAARGIAVVPTSAMVERVDGLIHEAFADIDTIKVLVLSLTILGIADLVLSNVLARRRDLAVLTLVGLPSSGLVRMARIEGLCIAAGAATCGTVVGGLCAWVWVHYNYPALVGYVLRLELSWSSVLISLGLAFGSAWLAAGGAARFALSAEALSIVRTE